MSDSPPSSSTEILLASCQACLDEDNMIVSGEDFRRVIEMIMRMAKHVERLESAMNQCSEINDMLISHLERLDVLHEAVSLGGPVDIRAFSEKNVEKLNHEVAEFLQKVVKTPPDEPG